MAKAETLERTKKKSGKWGWIFLVGIAGITYLGATNPAEDVVPLTSQERADKEVLERATHQARCTVERYGSGAFVAMKTYVKLQLNDPGSAKFAYRRDQVRVDRSSCTFFLTGEFSAKNGFGGRVRGAYDVQLMRTSKGGWVPLSIQLSR